MRAEKQTLIKSVCPSLHSHKMKVSDNMVNAKAKSWDEYMNHIERRGKENVKNSLEYLKKSPTIR